MTIDEQIVDCERMILEAYRQVRLVEEMANDSDNWVQCDIDLRQLYRDIDSMEYELYLLKEKR